MNRRHLINILATACISLFLGAGCVVGRIGYIVPAKSDARPAAAPIAEHCFAVFPGAMDEAMNAYQTKTQKDAWKNVNITFEQNAFDGCLQLRPLKGGN